MKNECIRKKMLHRAIIDVNKLHRKTAKNHFEELGITHGQPKLLDFLVEHDGCIQRELASHCHIEPATVTSILNTMEKSGLIERRQNPNDKRILNVFLTQKGKETQKSVFKVFQDLDRKCLIGFSKEEEEALMSYLGRIYDNLHRKEEGHA